MYVITQQNKFSVAAPSIAVGATHGCPKRPDACTQWCAAKMYDNGKCVKDECVCVLRSRR